MKSHFSLPPHISAFLFSILLIAVFTLHNIMPVHAESVFWVETGSLNTPRPLHTATVLVNGKVLVAGGHDGTANIASAELYDPASGTWLLTGSMNVARRTHQAILLPDGKVLVAGGDTDASPLSSAELYDPTTGTWTDTGSMSVGRYGFAAALLPDGKVLVAGGWDVVNDRAIRSAEIYDPTTGTWTATGSMNTGRNATRAILLANGKVLIAGGEDYPGHDLASAELYDPATGTWSYTASMNTDHGHYNPTVLLSNGKVMITGTADNPSCEIYDPATDTWTNTGSMNVTRRGHLAVLLPNGKVLAAGGSVAGVGGTTTSAEIYDPTTGTWTVTSSMNYPHYGPTASKLSNGKILVTGGDSTSGISELFFITNPPISNAGLDQSVDTLSEITLDGSASSDPDGDVPLTYFWTQTGGTPVQLNDPHLATPSFTAPSDPATISFSLTVTDSLGVSDPLGDEVIITVNNQAPIANAGPDQTVRIFSTVTLDGSGSTDTDADLPLSCLWVQTSGPEITLSDMGILNPTFTAPSEPSILKFSLFVTDSLGLTNLTPDEVIIEVQGYKVMLPLILR